MSPDFLKLAELHDIVTAQPVDWTPQTIGWYVLFGLLALFAFWALYRLAKYRKTNRYRKEALLRLESLKKEISQQKPPESVFSQLPVLVKQTVLAWAPREKIASLYGRQWLEFLDRTYRNGLFSEPPGRYLADMAFKRPAEEQTDMRELERLFEIVALWIKKHKPLELENEEAP